MFASGVDKWSNKCLWIASCCFFREELFSFLTMRDSFDLFAMNCGSAPIIVSPELRVVLMNIRNWSNRNSHLQTIDSSLLMFSLHKYSLWIDFKYCSFVFSYSGWPFMFFRDKELCSCFCERRGILLVNRSNGTYHVTKQTETVHQDLRNWLQRRFQRFRLKSVPGFMIHTELKQVFPDKLIFWQVLRDCICF